MTKSSSKDGPGGAAAGKQQQGKRNHASQSSTKVRTDTQDLPRSFTLPCSYLGRQERVRSRCFQKHLVVGRRLVHGKEGEHEPKKAKTTPTTESTQDPLGSLMAPMMVGAEVSDLLGSLKQ